jgi:hypothetical protein
MLPSRGLTLRSRRLEAGSTGRTFQGHRVDVTLYAERRLEAGYPWRIKGSISFFLQPRQLLEV